ncbi:RHS repeat domain-containing protein [Sorangium cellulosum]|uniref:RHS repeat domain-containing protein n=1 Tax=Sorangium cellulosum TaxID=56 RepID=UPI0004119C2F|nr:DUF6531 domain-containing protein [Sorangium cellulosum]
MAHNFHDINGWLIVGIEGHSGFHIFPPAPMWFWKLTLLHPFTLGDRQHPTVLFNGVPSVTHQHEPVFLWPHLGIIPDPLDALTPLHILFGSHKCWLPRGAVEICGEKATCCVIGGPVSLNADCWEYGKWPTSLVLNPGTVQTTPTFSDFAQGALTLAIDLVLDLAFEVVARAGGALLAKFAGDLVRPLFRKGDDVVGDGLRAATKNADEAGQEAAEKGAKDLADQGASAPPRSKCTEAGHPVDVTSGRVVDARVDLSLPGAIELSWERHYSSARALERTSLGRGGWAHSFEQRVERGEHRITLRDQEGRGVYFRAVKPGERAFHRGDRLTLTALPDGAFAVYDHESRLTRRFAPAEPRGPALLRSIEDAYGNAIALEYSGARLRRVIDTAGREVRVKLTHGGRIARLEVWAGDSLEQWVDYGYTAMGELASATDALGYADRYAYDEDHRMVKTTLKNGVSFHYEYDPETGWCRRTWGDGGIHAVEIVPDLERRITRLSGNDEPRILHWNEDGLVVREETPDGILIRTCAYDADLYLLAEANGAGEAIRYEYDAAYSLTGVQHDGYRLDIRLDRLGREVARHAPGQVTIRSERDALDRLIERTVSVGPPGGALSSVLAQRSWRYDENGLVNRLDDRRWGATAFAHDAMGQLVAAQRGARREVFDYDVAGSLRRMLERFEPAPQAEPAEQEPWQIAPGNRLVHTERATYSHDQRGRRVLKRSARSGADGQPDDTTAYVWDCRDQLREVRLPSGARVAFTYDAFGRRIRKEVFDDGTDLREVVEFVWDGDMLAADIHGQRGTRTFVHAPGTFLPLLQAEQGEVFCYVTDHVGTPRELIDAAGRVAWSGAYSAWGELRETFVDSERAARGRTVEPPFRLLGQYKDEESGLRYTRYRYFDPEVARWCSPDPLGIYGGNDLYGFGGAPTWSVDPFGLSHDIDVRITLADGTEIPEFRVTNVPGNRLLDSEVMLVQRLTGRTDLSGSTIRIFGEWHSCANCVNAMDNFRQLPENQGMVIQYTGLGAGRGGQGIPVTLYLGPDPVPSNMLGRDDYNAERDRRQRAARRRGGCG